MIKQRLSYFTNKSQAFLISFVAPLLFVLSHLIIKDSLNPWFFGLFCFLLLFFHSCLRTWFLFFLASAFLYFPFFLNSENVFFHILIPLLFTLSLFTGVFLIKWGLSFLIFKIIQVWNLVPKISQTESEALLAGNPWIEKEFFTGRPSFKKLFAQEFPTLSQEEKYFLDKKVDALCEISTEWDLMKRKQLDPQTEDFLKKEKFFGLIIPKKYQGLDFSHFAHAKIIEKISSSNAPLSIITMVPNSLGPSKLLLKYGTTTQKDKYLSNLALGKDLPCFGLTEVQAGSDASSILSEGILFKEGDRLKIRLQWDKRWISLSSKATVIGLAIKLKDPQAFYSDKKVLGITCLLVPGDAPGVQRGLFHDPMGMPFYNAPIKGRNVIVDAEEAIIGGLKQAGKGWKMLMESLSSGRGISLPSLALGAGKKISWLTGTHAFVRKQFGLPIGKFEGVEEALAHIAGFTHLMEATQSLTLSGLNQEKHFPVITALTKYKLTEIAQQITKKGMDVMGGAGLSLGPRNKIANLYISLPIGITVEGANILTRTLIVYGQGLIKTHPYVYKIITSIKEKAIKHFDKNFWNLIYQYQCNFVRTFFFCLTRARLYIVSNPLSKEHRYLQKLAWVSSLFSFLTDLNFLVIGEKLKAKGYLNGRFADLLSYQYIATALIWHSKQTDPSKSSWVKTQWGLEYCFAKAQESLESIFKNYPHYLVRQLLKPFAFCLRINPIGYPPSDILSKQLATQLLENEDFRNTLCSNMHFPKDPEDQFQKLKKAYELSLKQRPLLKRIKEKGNKKTSIKEALEQKIISSEEYEALNQLEQAQLEAVQVDSFTEKEYFGND